mmetsp:Transcript_3047/g.7189  ORF Transcript_3047/g.7189 Transcript_3047/m.7189 type:complete len:96 (-) Transcript_3047:113-400(-)
MFASGFDDLDDSSSYGSSPDNSDVDIFHVQGAGSSRTLEGKVRLHKSQRGSGHCKHREGREKKLHCALSLAEFRYLRLVGFFKMDLWCSVFSSEL